MFLSTSLYLSVCCMEMLALLLQPAAGDGPEDWEGVEADVTKWSGQRERLGGSAQHGGAADQRTEKGKRRRQKQTYSTPPPIMLDLLHVCCWLLIFFQEFHRLQDENIQLKTICEDQEQALEELGSKLSEYVGFEKAWPCFCGVKHNKVKFCEDSCYLFHSFTVCSFCCQIQTQDRRHQRSQQSSAGKAAVTAEQGLIRRTGSVLQRPAVTCVSSFFRVVRFGWTTRRPATASSVRRSFPFQDERSV